MFLNINCRTCLAGLIAFGLGDIAGVCFVGPKIKDLIKRMSIKWQNIIAYKLAALFIINIISVILFDFNKSGKVGGDIYQIIFFINYL